MRLLFSDLDSSRMSDYTYFGKPLDVEKVKLLVKEKKFHLHVLRKADKSTYTSAVWESGIFLMVYDSDNKIVRNFYYCKKCLKYQHINLNNGNSVLRRHGCYKKYLKEAKKQKNKKVKTDDNSDDEEDEVDERRVMLAKAFDEFRLLCQKEECRRATHLDFNDFLKIIPEQIDNENEW